ncbi:ABC-type branched-chain amino acid transport system, substrate-binding protein [Actinacidiphila yanglinensis]|uniref:ABC-type branched-chain amino acid transport system, substrate-binding protein n=1 Tax=Actinacidiphila yanglinensis TaxID=310779 RepID=A0A1H5ZBZ0_9ACTN|nr:ABC transporter substrate-binding protein [Actinacidiphila yanglinensis]SEG32876.1 ABC-type branched-chain amino acid transport system, substrate-binding protein [Actinacidiphila yanglinensis]
MTHRRMGALRRAVVPLLAVSALVSGCGVIPGSGGGSSGPIVVMTWAPVGTSATNMPGMLGMAKAVESYVNDQGGLDGRKLKVLTCNERNDAVTVTNCAKQAADAGAVAVIGSYSEEGSSFISALEGDGIPYIGGYGITEDEYQSLMSFPINGGLPALLAGSGLQLAQTCKKVTLVRPDSITGDQFPIFLDQGLQAADKKPVDDLLTQDNSTDYTAIATKAVGADKASSCVSAVLGDKTSTFFDALRRVGDTRPKVQLSSVIGSVQQSVIDASGGAKSPLEGAKIADWYPPASDPRWSEMKSVISKYAFGDDSIDVADPGVQTTWIAYTVFTKVVRAMGDKTKIDADSVRRAMDSTTKLSTGGLTPDLGWTDSDLLGIPDHPRMVNSKIVYQEVRDGRLVQAQPGFVDLTKTLKPTSYAPLKRNDG